MHKFPHLGCHQSFPVGLVLRIQLQRLPIRLARALVVLQAVLGRGLLIDREGKKKSEQSEKFRSEREWV